MFGHPLGAGEMIYEVCINPNLQAMVNVWACLSGERTRLEDWGQSRGRVIRG